jgi:D-alanyl-D-alanine carboxypeptidase/D-alanyl-D-alanine-endopeptidase (penicillin-binding protein 4)
VPSWNPSYIRENEIGPMSALDVNAGFTSWRPPIAAAPDPAAHAAATLTALLRARGVTVTGEGGSAKAPASAVDVASLDSPPLSDITGVMLRESDNLVAELLLKELGARFGGGGTTVAGVAVMKETLGPVVAAAGGDSAASFNTVDGSGLDRSDRLTCNVLQAALGKSGLSGVIGRDLPVAGSDGTLTKRFVGSPAAGKIRAKTGSLKGVVGLSGWATASDGSAVQFSLLANELPVDAAGTNLENNVVNTLVTYPQAPAPEQLGPQKPVGVAGPG